jgi:hypothetical protein
VCRASLAIVDGDEAGEQDGRINEQCRDRTRSKSRRLSGAMLTSCRLRLWTQQDDLVRASVMDLECLFIFVGVLCMFGYCWVLYAPLIGV